VEHRDCLGEACITCFRVAALEISHAIARSNKPSSALGRDGVSIGLAFATGVEIGLEAFGGKSTSLIDKQNLICECSFGPFPFEVSALPNLNWTKPELFRMKVSCPNVAVLKSSFCGAKKRRRRRPSAWHSAFELALKVASNQCADTKGCASETVDWQSNPLIIEELQKRGFRF